jgi:chromosomal replication initiator protein
VAEFFKLSPRDLKAQNRSKNILRPRQIAMYLTRKLTTLSLPQIGGAFGGKDHTTIMHSCKKIEQELLKDAELKDIIEKLFTVLRQ